MGYVQRRPLVPKHPVTLTLDPTSTCAQLPRGLEPRTLQHILVLGTRTLDSSSSTSRGLEPLSPLGKTQQPHLRLTPNLSEVSNTAGLLVWSYGYAAPSKNHKNYFSKHLQNLCIFFPNLFWKIISKSFQKSSQRDHKTPYQTLHRKPRQKIT